MRSINILLSIYNINTTGKGPSKVDEIQKKRKTATTKEKQQQKKTTSKCISKMNYHGTAIMSKSRS